MKVSTIHIFAYGEAQVITDEFNFKAPVDKFTKLQAVIDNIKSKKPQDKEDKPHHAINIFFNMRGDYNSTEKKGTFSVKFSDLDKSKLDELVAEFVTLKAQDDAQKKAQEEAKEKNN